jgi:GNAT superfamily N-acetyltransferase
MITTAKRTVATDMACSPKDFDKPGVTVVEYRSLPGRRQFPEPSRQLMIVTFGAGAVISCAPSRMPWVMDHLSRRRPDELFAAEAIARMYAIVSSEGQWLSGPGPRYLCSAETLRPCALADRVQLRTYAGADVGQLFEHAGFHNALEYRLTGLRPDVLACAAFHASKPVGIAGVSADCDAMWQVGIDVVAEWRGRGIGAALVSRVTRMVLDAGRVPYYATGMDNIASQRLAIGVGFWPAWTELYVKDK